MASLMFSAAEELEARSVSVIPQSRDCGIEGPRGATASLLHGIPRLRCAPLGMTLIHMRLHVYVTSREKTQLRGAGAALTDVGGPDAAALVKSPRRRRSLRLRFARQAGPGAREGLPSSRPYAPARSG